MAASDQNLDPQTRTARLLATGAEAEHELLKSERKAEKRLADAAAAVAREEARLRRVQEQLDRSRKVLAAAAEALTEVQARRAAGPAWPQD